MACNASALVVLASDRQPLRRAFEPRRVYSCLSSDEALKGYKLVRSLPHPSNPLADPWSMAAQNPASPISRIAVRRVDRRSILHAWGVSSCGRVQDHRNLCAATALEDLAAFTSSSTVLGPDKPVDRLEVNHAHRPHQFRSSAKYRANPVS